MIFIKSMRFGLAVSVPLVVGNNAIAQQRGDYDGWSMGPNMILFYWNDKNAH